MTREEQIKEAARQRADQYDHPSKWSDTYYGFIDGAHWADSHPQWYDAQGDNAPEYGREVIVIGRDGKVFYGHRPDPKEITMIDENGKVMYFDEVYEVDEPDWQQVRIQAAIAAMQGSLANPHCSQVQVESGIPFGQFYAINAVQIADALVAELKKGGQDERD